MFWNGDYMERLPKDYCESMKMLLGEEYAEYIDSFSESSHTALRVNTGKLSLEKWEEINPFVTNKVSWTEKGFYYDVKVENPAKHPYYYAGLYYIQEPSAMIPASILPIATGDKVLDLCAAPGGKATELGAKLGQTGILVANDISVSRAMALAKNLQFAGITNAVVTAEHPKKLSENFPLFFDKILIDAPCSGEGMFRREPRMIKDWMEKGPEYYAVIQKEILSYAYEMLKPGGMLVYSTCTFSVKEDEEVIQWLLEQYEDMKICPVERKAGFSKGRPDLLENGNKELENCIRIFPHKAKGEGHFAVLLEKTGELQKADNLQNLSDYRQNDRQGSRKERNKKGKSYNKRGQDSNLGKTGDLNVFLAELPLSQKDTLRNFSFEKEKVKWEIFGLPKLHSIRVIYSGLAVCDLKQKIIPAPQLALTLSKDDYVQSIDLKVSDERVIRYLKGETLQAEEKYKGNILVCVDGYGLGWCQGNGQGTLKNKYYSGWRYQ